MTHENNATLELFEEPTETMGETQMDLLELTQSLRTPDAAPAKAAYAAKAAKDAAAHEEATTGFNGMGLPEKLLQALTRMNFTKPTPIQEQAIPLAMQGRDILGSAQTGTGKTGAFGIPLIAKLMENPQACALVMTPTRELAAQVLAALEQMIPLQNLKTALLIGGEPMPKQFSQLKIFPRLIVGTPGRINDHLVRGTLKLNRTEFLVLDETDRMLDMGFSVQLEKIAQFLPKTRQTMMFSATMPNSILKMANAYLTNPERITVGSTTNPAANIKQETVNVNESDKYSVLLEQLAQREGSVIIFVKTKHGTERLADKLCAMDYRADAIHGDLQQRKRDRVIHSFREKKFRVLVATDVAARGLDIPHIEHVINYDLPQCPEDYIHRIGRTARAGATGAAVNLLTPADKIKWKAIQRLMNPNAVQEDEPRRGGFNERSGSSKPRSGGGGFGRSNGGGDRNRSFGGDRNEGRSFGGERPRGDRPSYSDRPQGEGRPAFDRPQGDRAQSAGRPSYSNDAPRQNDNRPRDTAGRPYGGSNSQPSQPRYEARSTEGRGEGRSFDGDRAPRGENRSSFGGGRPQGGSQGGRPSFGGGGRPNGGGGKKFGAPRSGGGRFSRDAA